MVGNGQIKDEETVDNTHKTNLYPPLGKGRLGGDDCTKKLPTPCLQIINSPLCGHPLLRLPFPRGGYQLAFPLIVPYLSLPTVNLPAAEKTRCYFAVVGKRQSNKVFFLLCVVGNGQIKDEETVDNAHKTNRYPPLRKGRLGGDDCTKKLPTPCLQIINSLLCGHPLLRLPFPRGGYQLAFLQTVACTFP